MSTRTLISLTCAATLAIAAAGLSAAPSPTPKVDKAPMAFDKPPAAGTKATCPVSKEQFTVSASTVRSEHKGKHYVFCCPECKPDFDKDPEKYLRTKAGSEPHGAKAK